jgi:hypothetical protein
MINVLVDLVKKRVVLFVSLSVFNAIFNNISVVFLQSVFFVEETGIPGENHCPAKNYRQS